MLTNQSFIVTFNLTKDRLLKFMQKLGISKTLLFINNETTYRATINFYKFEEDIHTHNLNKFLHQKELQRANSYNIDKRNISYTMGRISGKLAIKNHLDLEETKSFYIENGVLNQPVIIGLDSPNLQISLSHTQNFSVGLVYEERHPMGIDIENYDDSNSKELLSILSINESNLISQTDPIILWTAKESLSKCLKTGFTVPLEWFEVDKIVQLSNYRFDIYFSNFIQFKATVIIADQYIVAVSYHIDSELKSEEWFDIYKALIQYQNI